MKCRTWLTSGDEEEEEEEEVDGGGGRGGGALPEATTERNCAESKESWC